MSSTQLRREIGGIALLLFGIFLAGVLIAHGLGELRTGVDTRGTFGWVGSSLARPLITMFGWPAALIIPLVPVAQALRLFGRGAGSVQAVTGGASRRRTSGRSRGDAGDEADGGIRSDRRWIILAAGLVLLIPIALGLTQGGLRQPSLLAGVWGMFAAYYALEWFGAGGAWLFVLFGASVLTAATLHWNPIRLLVGHAPRAGSSVAPTIRTAVGAEGREGAEAIGQRLGEKGWGKRKRDKGEEDSTSTLLEPAPEEMPGVDPSLMVAGAGTAVAGETELVAGTEGGLFGGRRRRKSRAEAAEEREVEIAAAIEATADATDPRGDELPVPELLTPAPTHNAEINARELDEAGIKLMEALQTFRVQGELVGRTTGPVVTQFEIEPAPGVKVRQFANLANDLALAMRAQSIRIVAPIPGRGAVGVEVPNPTPEIVAFRELIESREFQLARAALPIALGKDLEGKPVIADLAKMPHLLIAGATGSGKSVCVNTLITSLIYRHTPKTLRFLMVDPKMVELSVYNILPHLRHKVVTDNRDAAAVLKWAVLEMQERYEILAVNGCRNIQDFNRRLQEGVPLKRPKTPGVGFEDDTWTGSVLPYIVVVIDELADLMMTVQGEVETPLAMLAQKARAIGIHLILATQRPSVNVITGLIKANFPSRIAFRVASQVDSRTILDGVGAEALLGNGDMLFIPPGKSEPARLQGAFISSEDTENLTRWYEERREERRARFEAEGLFPEEPVQSEPDILETVRQRELLESGQADPDGEEPGDRDKLFREAAEVVIQHQQGSTSLLQRRLKVGYGRAARIIDQLHAAGVLGPPDGSKPRDVLAGLEDLDRICGPR